MTLTLEHKLSFAGTEATLYGFELDRTTDIAAAKAKHVGKGSWKFYKRGTFEYLMALPTPTGILAVMPHCIDGVRTEANKE